MCWESAERSDPQVARKAWNIQGLAGVYLHGFGSILGGLWGCPDYCRIVPYDSSKCLILPERECVSMSGYVRMMSLY